MLLFSEMLYEDESFNNRELAALIASKVCMKSMYIPALYFMHSACCSICIYSIIIMHTIKTIYHWLCFQYTCKY